MWKQGGVCGQAALSQSDSLNGRRFVLAPVARSATGSSMRRPAAHLPDVRSFRSPMPVCVLPVHVSQRARAAVLAVAWYARSSLAIGPGLVAADDDAAFAKIVSPFVAKHCVSCHGPKKQKGDLKLDGLDGRRLGDDAELWSKILERLATGDMPPADEPRPSRAEVAPVVDWIHDSLVRSGGGEELAFPDKGNHVPHEVLFGPIAKDAAPPASPARLWRISPYQYQALIAGVGGDRYRPERGLQTKAGALPVPFGYRGGPGLQDYSSLYRIDEGQTEQLVLNARDLARRMFAITNAELKNRKESEFKVFDKYLTPRGLEAMVSQKEELSDEQVTRFVDTISFLVFRRGPTDDERRRYGDFLRQETRRYGNRTGMENVLAAYLLHPAAMFRIVTHSSSADLLDFMPATSTVPLNSPLKKWGTKPARV